MRKLLECGSRLPLSHSRQLPVGRWLEVIRHLQPIDPEPID